MKASNLFGLLALGGVELGILPLSYYLWEEDKYN
jgi:hypothetical protein